MNLFHHVSIDTFYLPTLPAMGRVGFFVPHEAPMKPPWRPHEAPMPLIRGYLASLGGASRPPVYPPGTAAHGRVLARSASEAGAERQRSGSRRVQRGTPRSRTTREHIRDTHGTCRGRTGRQQPPPPDAHPSPVCRAVPRGTWRGAPPT